MILPVDELQLPVLPDYQAWKNVNYDSQFTLIDYVYGIHQKHQFHPDFFVALMELMWPKFVEIDNHIFLKLAFNAARYEQLRTTMNYPSEVEYWMNFTVLDGLFESSKEGFYHDHAEYVLTAIPEMWESRLHMVFPEKKFTVSIIKDSENGDFGIAFSQNR